MKKLFACFLSLASAAAFGTTTVPVQLLNPTGSSSGQTIVSAGAATAPGWGTLGLSGLSAISANTLVGNSTGASATPTAVSVTGCNGAAQALQWTNGSGFGCNSSIATSGANSNITALNGLTSPVTLPGVTSGACASAGNVGECKNANVPQGSAVALTNNVAANVTSVPLTAGNWLCYGNVGFSPAGTTSTSQELGWISTTSAAVPTPTGLGAEIGLTTLGSTGGGNADILPVGMLMVNVATTATVYLSAYASFTTSTNVAYGYINCIRWH